MRKENLSIKVPVVDKNGVSREFVFRKGKPVGEGMPNSFCERNCELYTICERVKSPVAVEDPKEDTLQIWCAQQDFDSSYYPHNIIQEMPELFEGVIDQDPAFRLSEIKEKICPDFCMDYVEGEVCEKCKIPGNDFCMVSRLITNKIKNRDESEE
jgi:hypothetical protein